jgi:hypothetical protein
MPLFLLAATTTRPVAEPGSAEPTPAQAVLLGVLLASLCFAIRIFRQVPSKSAPPSRRASSHPSPL